MDLNRPKFFARIASAALCLAAIGTLALAFTLPVRVEENGNSKPIAKGQSSRAVHAEVPLDAEAFESVIDLDLRRPLFDAVPSVPLATRMATQPAAPDLQLTGTFVDTDRAYAVFSTNAGLVEVRSVGQKTGSAEVVRIEPGIVTLRLNGQPIVLRVRKPASQIP